MQLTNSLLHVRTYLKIAPATKNHYIEQVSEAESGYETPADIQPTMIVMNEGVICITRAPYAILVTLH